MAIFYLKNNNLKKSNFRIFLKTKTDPNIHQNAPNCTI